MSNSTHAKPHVAAVNVRLAAGEMVTVGEVVEAVVADTSMADLDALAARLTTQTGTPHRVFRTPRGYAVYPESYESAVTEAGLEAVRIDA